MKASTLISSLAAAASLVAAQYSPACHGIERDGHDGVKNCECCVVWSYTQHACVQARKGKGQHYQTCYSLFKAPIGSAVGPKGCGIWSMDKKKCYEWLDGYEDGFTQPDSGPDLLQISLASAYGSTFAPTPTGPRLTVEAGSTKVVTSTSVVLVTSMLGGDGAAAAEATSTGGRKVLVTVTA